jgi:hypothetical protein
MIDAPRSAALGLQRPVQKRQADVHPVVDVRVIVVVLLVHVPDAGLGQPQRQQPRAVMDVILVAPAAVDVDPLERAQVRRVLADQIPAGAPMVEVLDAMQNGYAMLQNRLEKSLDRHGIARIECLGRMADPYSVTVVDVVEDARRRPGTVVEVIRQGYLWQHHQPEPLLHL